MDLEQELRAIIEKYGLTEQELVSKLPSPGWVAIHGVTEEKYVKLAELIAKDLAERKGNANMQSEIAALREKLEKVKKKAARVDRDSLTYDLYRRKIRYLSETLEKLLAEKE